MTSDRQPPVGAQLQPTTRERAARRLWSEDGRVGLAALVGIEAVLLTYTVVLGGNPAGEQAVWSAVTWALIWATYRRHRVAHRVLVALTVLPLLQTVAAVMAPTWYAVGVIALLVAELTLLLSPAVRHHVHQPGT